MSMAPGIRRFAEAPLKIIKKCLGIKIRFTKIVNHGFCWIFSNQLK